LRPTGDRIRETLFNWLQFEWEGSQWLDVFSGSGALGFEALSRGASEVVMLEKSTLVAKQLQANKQLLAAEGASIVNTDSQKWLLNNTQQKTFDGVFLDPPFRHADLDLWLTLLITNGWLKPNAWLYIEQPKERVPSLPYLRAYRQQQSGGVSFGLWQLQTPESELAS
jgi:16S rRNA (guanine966-N2)-methyltransferase